MGIRKAAVLNDIHFPEESDAYDLALLIMEDQMVDEIYLNGDIVEFESVSRHEKRPDGKKLIKEEIDYARTRLDEMEGMFSDIPIHWIMGNHENRLNSYIARCSPELYGLCLDIPSLFELDLRDNVYFYPYEPEQLVQCGESNLYLRHEPVSGGVGCARATALHSTVDIMFGHTHIATQYSMMKYAADGKMPVTAYGNPWLGNKSAKCFNYRGAKANWQTGFSLITYDDVTGEYEVDTIIIEDGETFYRGKTYRLND